MLLGVGIDILSLTRFKAVIAHRSPQALAKRICSPVELKRFQTLLPSGDITPTTPSAEVVQFLSKRWVLKEAAYKALSGHISAGLNWKSLHVDNLPSGQPTVRYSPDDTSAGRDVSMVGMEVDLMCTLSHDAGVVVGVVIAQTKI